MTKVVVAVSGSVAAWKACDLVSKLVQAGRTVDVVMTRAACGFVRPLAFSALTHRDVFTDRTWTAAGMPHAHLRMTSDAQLLIVAPATANLLAKFAHGIADDVVSTTYLAAACPVLVAPAMNPRMWEHPRTRENVRILAEDGVEVIGPAPGWLSEGEVGTGRMSEPADILLAANALL